MHYEYMHPPSCVGAATLATGLISSSLTPVRLTLALSARNYTGTAVDKCRNPPRAHADYDSATLSTSAPLSTRLRKVVTTTNLACRHALGFTNGAPRFVLTNPAAAILALPDAAPLWPAIHRYKTT